MSHAYVSNLMHCIFSTKERVPLIDLDLESRLWPYLGGIATQNEMKALASEAPLTTFILCCRYLQRWRYQKPCNC
jgi:hypothetical protein